MLAALVCTLPVVLSAPAQQPAQQPAPQQDDAPRRIAVAYLKALDGSGPQEVRELLLGGLTLSGEEARIPNWKIQERVVQKEQLDVTGATGLMKALDESGAKALTNIMNLAEGGGDDDVGMETVTQDQANKLMAPTRAAAAVFKKKYPVFAYCSRAGKDVYWHPSNPWRQVVKELGSEGEYTLEMHRFNVLEKSKDGTRAWPLRVLRIRAGGYDSGWKILPASDWDPDW